MERLRKQQLLEQSIYGAIWTVIFLLPLIGGYFAVSGGLEKEEIRVIVYDSWLSILPFFVLFLLNNYGLVPYFLFKKKYWYYIISLVFLISTLVGLFLIPLWSVFQRNSDMAIFARVKEKSRETRLLR